MSSLFEQLDAYEAQKRKLDAEKETLREEAKTTGKRLSRLLELKEKARTLRVDDLEAECKQNIVGENQRGEEIHSRMVEISKEKEEIRTLETNLIFSIISEAKKKKIHQLQRNEMIQTLNAQLEILKLSYEKKKAELALKNEEERQRELIKYVSFIRNETDGVLRPMEGSDLKWEQEDGGWNEASPVELSFIPVTTPLDTLLLGTEIKPEKLHVKVQARKKPFAKGGVRYAYYMRLWRPGSTTFEKWVYKEFKNPSNSRNNAIIMFHMQSLCTAFAKEFMQEQLKVTSTSTALFKNCEFLPMFLLQFPGHTELLMAEPLLTGLFIKFNDNDGNIYEDSKTAQAFSHFSHQVSKRKGKELIIVDLQGVRVGNNMIWTDPAMHSIPLLFGPTDRGKEGIALFYKTHKCSPVCARFSLATGAVQECCDTVVRT